MKRLLIVTGFLLMALLLPQEKAAAQIPILQIIKAAITKVIKAVDLQVQRLQNNTIWLQNAQKVIENAMSQLHLNEITGWVQKQKDLYAEYYDELEKVKSLIAYYHQIKEITEKQQQLVASYKHAWGLLKTDKHFTPGEINYMGNVYTGILNETVQNVDQLLNVVNSFATKMSDAKRLEIINATADKVDENYSDLSRFNTQNSLLSLSRSKDEYDARLVKAMYDLK